MLLFQTSREIIFYFQHFIQVCFYSLGKKTGRGGPPLATALRPPAYGPKLQSWPKVLGTLEKTTTGDALIWSEKLLFYLLNPPSPKTMLEQWVYFGWVNINIVLGVGRGRWTERPYVDQHCTGLAQISLLPSRIFINSVCSSWLGLLIPVKIYKFVLPQMAQEGKDMESVFKETRFVLRETW